MTINILTIFPDYFNSPLAESMIGRAINDNKVKINIINIRDFATDKHKVTDDRPFGGGPGMVMKVEPIDHALKALVSSRSQNSSSKNSHLASQSFSNKVILTSAKGKLFTQQVAQGFAQLDELTIICGHYEGVDERVVDHLIDEEIRIGDYVMTGGEPAALVIADVVTRLIPGVLGNDQSNKDESHSIPGQLGHPTYTRPEDYRGWKVPSVLLCGDQKKIDEWKKEHKTKAV